MQLTDQRIEEIICETADAWNAQADTKNQWPDLGRDEKDLLIARAIEAEVLAAQRNDMQLDEGTIVSAVQKACGGYRTGASYDFEDVWNCIEAAFSLATHSAGAQGGERHVEEIERIERAKGE